MRPWDNAPLTPDHQRRLINALLASAATGAVIYVLVMHVALPWLQTRLTEAQIEWLRRAFADHPFIVLGTIVVTAAVLGLPVLLAFWWVYRRGRASVASEDATRSRRRG
jgi:NADH:ubiquinone oxidoreductase subunit 2 (subunit N)